MVDDMESYKIKVNNEAESKEIQELFFELGYGWCCGDIKKARNTSSSYIYCYKISKGMAFGNWDESFYNHENKEITLQYLRDLVVLKRNDVGDATHETNGYKFYVSEDSVFEYIGGWKDASEYIEDFNLNPIEKEVKMKEYLDTNYWLRNVKQTGGDNHVPSGWIEVPEGAEEYRSNGKFYKNNGELYYSSFDEWINPYIPSEYKTIWKRNHTIAPNTSIQDKLKFIEKWLNGEKIQYILGVESEKTQVDESKWHNFTEGAMQYIKRSDIKFREAPKYVTINGIEFKSVEKLLKYVKNNFDLEDGGIE